MTSSITGAANAGSLKALLELYVESISEIMLAALLDQYEVLLFGAYGVLVHADGALPGAAALLAHLQRLATAVLPITPTHLCSTYRLGS